MRRIRFWMSERDFCKRLQLQGYYFPALLLGLYGNSRGGRAYISRN